MVNTTRYGFNVSEKHKMLWWAPIRTGTRTVSQILGYNGFKFEGKPTGFGYTHYCGIEEKYSEYDIICSCRNPYDKIVSIFKNYYPTYPEKNKETFRDFILDNLNTQQFIDLVNNPKIVKKPKYFVRIENLKEDLLKLPFIYDVLDEERLDLILEHGKQLDSWEEYYDQNIKDKVYNKLKTLFIVFGYSK
jgi:hypothetical protein